MSSRGHCAGRVRSNKWEATPEQHHELIGIMRGRYPDKTEVELLEMLRAMDPTDFYEMLLGHGRDGEWSPPDRFHTGGWQDAPSSAQPAMDNLGRIDSPSSF